MGSAADKANGLANEAVVKPKQGVGNVIGCDKLKTEGAAQKLKGDALSGGRREDGRKGRGQQSRRPSAPEALIWQTSLRPDA
jgi:uncharacterized protein YjbJ (UPF0337 family)